MSATLSGALEAFADAVGADAVLTGEEELREFRTRSHSRPGTTTRRRRS